LELGLDPDEPVLLVMGGSQGAGAINELVMAALPGLRQQLPRLQIIHLTGMGNRARVEQAYHAWQGRALVKDFAGKMEVIMGASTLAISRAGASTLAELAASGLASVLVPYPRASDNHQYYNARAMADNGAALLFEETAASPAALVSEVRGFLDDPEAGRSMRAALGRWHRSDAAVHIAAEIMTRIGLTLLREVEGGGRSEPGGGGRGNGAPGQRSESGGMRRELQESWHG
jgi:UDP-N-acetylglucosamine--N-acetylmuramyl-(pentapeptide) pyrophosphoryl-undecaprenol N-acetylglucosamine transferase